MQLEGIIPIVFVPFDDAGNIDETSLRKVVRFELDGGVHGLGINGFASEAYKLSDDERRKTVQIVVSEVANQVPLIIGIAPNSTETAIQQAREFAQYRPAALMTLPPPTMDNGIESFVEYYVTLGKASEIPIIVQQSPHIPQYRHCELPASAMADIATASPNVCYFKIEGPGSADKMGMLKPLLPDTVKMFGGGGGITLLTELRNGAAGLIPGVGFNEFFLDAWAAWQAGDQSRAQSIIETADPLVKAVSGSGHEYSLHIRKHLMKRAGVIQSNYVRRPTCSFDDGDLHAIFDLVDSLNIRISQ